MFNDRILPAEADVKMVYNALLHQGWASFSDIRDNRRNNFDPWKMFPGAQPFKASHEQHAEPLLFFAEGVCFGVFDETGFGYYDYDATIAPNGLDDNDLDGKVVFFPYENVNAYR